MIDGLALKRLISDTTVTFGTRGKPNKAKFDGEKVLVTKGGEITVSAHKSQ